jgi:H(+)-transporting ATP synthase subunit D
MIQGRPTPTRQYLIQAERALARLGRGIALLRRKREALAASLFRLAAPAVDTHARIADRAARAHRLLALALGDLGENGVAPLAWPGRQVTVQLEPGTVWGLPAARLESVPPVERSLAARAAPPMATGGAAALAADAYEELLALLLRSAPEALLLRRLAGALARTSRQVNALERRVAPDLRANVERVRRQLEEREREELVRLAVAARSAPRLRLP